MNRKRLILGAVLAGTLLAGILIGWMAGHRHHPAHEPETLHATGSTVRFWTCAMHPEIRQPNPGRCPICAMKLVPVMEEPAAGAVGPREVRLSPSALRLAQIETAPVERRFAPVEVRMVGRIGFDETRLATISARFPGRLEQLFVNFTGVRVQEGDHLASIYSPELLVAQQELILAAQAVRNETAGSGSTSRASATLASAREKMRLWGLTAEQIREVEESGRASDRMVIRSPGSGVVVEKSALAGSYVSTGEALFRVADLSHLWVLLEAFESDLPWLHYGQPVEFEAEALPGERFEGKIALIAPVIDPSRRTATVRVNVPNAHGRLKPEMFVRARVRALTTASGRVFDDSLAGRWISPMHPEIVKDHPGDCDVCGMPLVSAESLGYAPHEHAVAEAPLLIPASAPLITGRRAVVYVALPEQEGAFEGREIVLGPRAGDFYQVRDGLAEGELVVVRGNFKIDSEVQIQARPSMMNPHGGGAVPGHDHGTLAPRSAEHPTRAAATAAPDGGVHRHD